MIILFEDLNNRSVGPWGIVKFNTKFGAVPVMVAVALVPGLPVVTVPIVNVGVILGPVGPVGPVAPAGIVKSSTALVVVPLFVTLACVSGNPVVVVPVVIVAGPAGPVGPVGP